MLQKCSLVGEFCISRPTIRCNIFISSLKIITTPDKMLSTKLIVDKNILSTNRIFGKNSPSANVLSLRYLSAKCLAPTYDNVLKICLSAATLGTVCNNLTKKNSVSNYAHSNSI